ncbi:MAG: UvrD-helicase domain-containing protein [Calothrix sp. FI2-JRJ7]|jgi:DNA helicase-2/ATP-dependent DNA helicase PcrA|nr:UvrD-helicase domain-containing protein [Calothrix sp. FI2-JRJ7]
MSQYKPNLEQQKIINHINGAILVLAPVGSGKTLVLSERVVQAIKSGIPAQKILCMTFTNRAAKEMSERLARVYPSEFRYITIKTFHSLCATMLRIEAKQIGLPADFVVYDDTDCKEVIKEVFGYSKDKDIEKAFFDITNCKSKAASSDLSSIYPQDKLFRPLGEYTAKRVRRYHEILQQRHALDFADLVFYVRTMFNNQREIKQRWQERFDFIQVDEVQDTHLSEYEIVRNLALRSVNIAMIGDLDQTIYEWRGSEPGNVISAFRQEFNPTIYPLTYNHRATQILLKAASGFAESFNQRQTNITPSPDCKLGELIQVHLAKTEFTEAEWIGKKIQKLAENNQNFAYNRVAVLARTNYRIEKISSVLEKLGIPCITVEQYRFFNRQEVKDALAYLRLMLNPFDTGAMRRMLLRPSRGIGLATIQNVIEEGQTCGFRLTDMVSSQTFVDGDPFSNLLAAKASGTLVVFDVETTGLEVSKDEVVEIAAAKLVNGKLKAEFHAYIANTVSVGDSITVHGYSNEFLAANGRPAFEVFREFFDFAEGALLMGHNVGFDIKMVTAHASKVGIKFPKFQWADTWDLANRFLEADSYSLETLASKLGLAHLPSHKAIDDTRTTVELLEALIPAIEHCAAYRQALVYRYGLEFEGLAQQVESWRDTSQKLRPADLLNNLLKESGLYAYYQADEKRRQNLLNLVTIFRELDNLKLHPDVALRSIVEFTALAKNLDAYSQQDNQVMMVTVHQSKGLEFDTVFIAGAVAGEFPNYLSLGSEKIEEEKRLFYVAMTRAKQQLFISAFLKDSRDYSKVPSQFIDLILKEYLEYQD